jgi:hypothetical protein
MVPELPNISVTQRENTRFDLDAGGEVLTNSALWQKSTRFVMLNASVRGPFLPFYTALCWTDLFLDGLLDRVKVFE